MSRVFALLELPVSLEKEEIEDSYVYDIPLKTENALPLGTSITLDDVDEGDTLVVREISYHNAFDVCYLWVGFDEDEEESLKRYARQRVSKG